MVQMLLALESEGLSVKKTVQMLLAQESEGLSVKEKVQMLTLTPVKARLLGERPTAKEYEIKPRQDFHEEGAVRAFAWIMCSRR
ncbi:hypothetical protein NDU88_001132 [Pleurodeles waltl]|uniref:Uncharacterized protein n=1 Tax=Pleurodeles waltl TaxID=8319 RepID=A0AAV7Q8V5_PLEWA|nr:hypothetical protein NDU88_001132 [Pleurodeles waltl]